MATKRTGAKYIDRQALESSVAALSGKLTGAVPLKQGTVLIRLTDSGEELSVEGMGRELRMAAAASPGTPLVEISGPSSVIKAIIDGKKEASRAFIAGGLQVRGDLNYLEALLKDLNLLDCGE